MKALLLFLFAGLVLISGVAPAPAQEPPADDSASTAVQQNIPPEGLESPRETLRTFLVNMRNEKDGEDGAWRRAAETLDLSETPGIGRDAIARNAVFELHEIINRLIFVQYEQYPSFFRGDSYTFYQDDEENFQITMTRGEDGGWRFSARTVEEIADILNLVKDRPLIAGTQQTSFFEDPGTWLRVTLPTWFFERTIVLENFQWFMLLLFILFGFTADRVLRLLLKRSVIRYFKESEFQADIESLYRLVKWAGMSLMGLIWLSGLRLLGLEGVVYQIIYLGVFIFVVTSLIAALLAIVDFVSEYLIVQASHTPSKFDDILIPLVRKTIKAFIIVFGVIFVGDNLPGIDVTGLLAGLGIGGLAFALAAKDTVENIFGSVAILVDRPFEIGDWVVVEGAEGNVEMVGLRSTRIRTFYNSQITVPNSNLIRAKVDNLGRRRYRRVKTLLSVTYNTPPERIDAFCEGIREIIRQHPYTRKDYYHVWLNEFGPHSLDILLYAFFEAPDWATELREKHRLFLDVIRLAHRLGIEFAFPTQTLYLERGQGPAQPDPEPFRTRAEMMMQRADARHHVEEIVQKLLRDGTVSFPPPPVKFDGKYDPEEEEARPRDLGGDTGSE